jgi:glutamate-1-semialdehyde 2,1-aminomutase
MPAVEMFRMLGSGTEGVMAAIRAARAFTEKKYVIKVGGAYHGWSDQMVYGLHIPGTGRLEATGIPRGASASTGEFFPNSLAALRRKLIVNQLRGGTAASSWNPSDRSQARAPSRLTSIKKSVSYVMNLAHF